MSQPKLFNVRQTEPIRHGKSQMHCLVKPNQKKNPPNNNNAPLHLPQAIYYARQVTESWLPSLDAGNCSAELQKHHLVEGFVDTNFSPSQHFNNHSFVWSSYKHPLWMAGQDKTITNLGFAKLDLLK